MSPRPHVAVITLNWNGLEDSKECLEALLENTYPNYSLYLVDNASEKDELKEIKAFYSEKYPRHSAKMRFIQNKKNFGFAKGNNVAIKQALEAGADYIFTLNNDTVVDSNFIAEAVKETSKQEERIGIVATKMVNYYDHSKLDNTGHNILTSSDIVPRGRNSKSSSATPKTQPMGACAGAALYSAKMLKEIGLFDEDFFLNHEDGDLSLRAIVQGWKVSYCPKSIVYHKISTSIKKIKRTPFQIRSQRNQLWAYLHSTPALVITLNLPWILLRDLTILILSLLTFRWRITKVVLCSRWQVITSLPKVLKKRRKIMKNRQVSSLWYWKQQRPFFKTYWGYFKEVILGAG